MDAAGVSAIVYPTWDNPPRLIGELLETGQGIAPDAVQALDWYRKAGAQGVSSAIARLKILDPSFVPPRGKKLEAPAAPNAAEAPRSRPAVIDEKDSRIAIFVGPQSRDGFVDLDSGVLDSIRDIKSELTGKKGLQVVADKQRAQVVIEVLSRGATSSQGGGAVAMPIGTSTFVIPIGTIGIATVLRVGSYEKQIVFQNCGSWRYCGRLVAKDIDTWIEGNRSAISQR